MAVPVGLASDVAVHGGGPCRLASEAALHESRFTFPLLTFAPLRPWPTAKGGDGAESALREILPSGVHTREAVGGPGLGADTVVDEEKASGIVFFFDRF